MTTHKTLEQLEKDVWPGPDYPSHVVTTCYRLRKKPLRDFTTEDLRIMISQQIGVRHLTPLAIEVLKANPLAEGDFYPGDLLIAVARLPVSTFDKVTHGDLVAICRDALVATDPALSSERHVLDAFLAGRCP